MSRSVLALILLALIQGCMGNPPANTSGPANVSPNPGQPSGSGVGQSSGGSTTAVAGGKGKWLGDIPYDVFLDDPVAIAGDNRPVGVAMNVPANNTPNSLAAESTPPPSTPANPNPAPAVSSGAGDWKSLIPMEVLQEEMKKLRNRCKESLSSLSKYNGNYKDIQVDGAVIAAVAAMVIEHPDSCSWKGNAKFIRDQGFVLRESSKTLGNKGFEASTAAFEKISSILDGNAPSDSGKSDDKRPFPDVASRLGLMSRMERADKWLRTEINTDKKFASQAEGVAHEATLLAALSRIISTGYESSDEDSYKKHSQLMIKASLECVASSKEGDFKKFSDSLNVLKKSCDDCHLDYRFADK